MVQLLFTALLFFSSWAAVANLEDPSKGKLVVWPNIPFISASDIEEYKLDRDLFKGLHTGDEDPVALKAAMKQVDKLYKHHKERATDRLGRTYNTDLIGYYDRLVKEQKVPSSRLNFSFNGIVPSQLSEELDLKAEPIEQLKAREDVVGVAAYVTTTKMSLKQLRATLTLIQLKDGVSRSFSVTDQAHKIAQRHAQQLFDFVYGPVFPDYRDPLESMTWLLPAPSNQGKLVSQMEAAMACRSQGAVLPTVDQLMLGEQAGPYHQGIILKAGQFYHAGNDKRYLAGETEDPRGKIRLLRSNRQKARYYCIQDRPSPVSKPVQTVQEKPQTKPVDSDQQTAAK